MGRGFRRGADNVDDWEDVVEGAADEGEEPEGGMCETSKAGSWHRGMVCDWGAVLAAGGAGRKARRVPVAVAPVGGWLLGRVSPPVAYATPAP